MSEVKFDAAIQMVQIQNELLTSYGIDIESRSFSLVGEINDDMYRSFDVALTLLEGSGRKGVTIKLSSAGGDLHATLAIIGRMRMSVCKITIEAFGQICSGAFNILAAGHKRRLSRYTIVMHHEVSYEVSGKHSEIKDLAKEMDREERIRADLMAEFTKAPASFWLTEGTRTDRYFKPQELLSLGVVDEII